MNQLEKPQYVLESHELCRRLHLDKHDEPGFHLLSDEALVRPDDAGIPGPIGATQAAPTLPLNPVSPAKEDCCDREQAQTSDIPDRQLSLRNDNHAEIDRPASGRGDLV